MKIVTCRIAGYRIIICIPEINTGMIATRIHVFYGPITHSLKYDAIIFLLHIQVFYLNPRTGHPGISAYAINIRTALRKYRWGTRTSDCLTLPIQNHIRGLNKDCNIMRCTENILLDIQIIGSRFFNMPIMGTIST